MYRVDKDGDVVMYCFCMALTRYKEPCRNKVKPDEKYCHLHKDKAKPQERFNVTWHKST